jgi:hypothetical protein
MNTSPLEDRLSRTFDAIASEIQAGPEDAPFADISLRRGRRPSRSVRNRVVLATGLIGGLALAGTGLAAAAGTFNSRADHAFRQDSANAPLSPPSDLPAPFKRGTSPSTSTTQPFDPNKETLEATSPGPDGTSVGVWTYQSSPTSECVAIVESAIGDATAPGKSGTGTAGGCSGSLTPSGTQPQTGTSSASYHEDSGVWRSSSGTLYQLAAGNAPVESTEVVMTLADGTTVSASVTNGWYVLAIPYSEWAPGYSGVFYGHSGAQIPGTVTGGGSTPPTSAGQ